jgi:methylated-DNA-[protein]-cysteine S-methyltransferase
LKICKYESPIGTLTLEFEDSKLVSVDFGDIKTSEGQVCVQEHIRDIATQLDEYFNGDREAFDIETAPKVTDFQRMVLDEIKKIPYGITVPYSQIARNIGKPKASRAVGAACGANPIPVIIPCHRVVGKDESLTGYGGGLDIKRFLLDLEKTNK